MNGYYITAADVVRDCLVDQFWGKHESLVFKRYLKQKLSDDVVISASPMFLLSPICKRPGVRPPIATEVELATGKLKGWNCKSIEKVYRFLTQYPNAEIQNFYFGSQSDTPLAALAQKAFLVQRGTLQPGDHLHCGGQQTHELGKSIQKVSRHHSLWSIWSPNDNDQHCGLLAAISSCWFAHDGKYSHCMVYSSFIRLYHKPKVGFSGHRPHKERDYKRN